MKKYEYKKPEANREWLKHYGNIPTTLEYPSMSMAELMLERANKYHSYKALSYFQSGLSHEENFDEFASNIELTAKMLKLNGVEKGDRVIVMMPYLPEAYYSIYAVAALGATLVPLHPNESKNHRRMAEIIEDTKATTIVCLDACAYDLEIIFAENKAINDLVRRVLHVTPVDSLKQRGIKGIINPIIDKKYAKSPNAPQNMPKSGMKFANFASELRVARNFKGNFMANVNGQDDAAIIFTSGTSGNKQAGCIHTHDAFNSLALGSHEICYEKPGSKAIVVPGLFHCFGLETATHTCLTHGVTQIVIPNPKDIKAMAEAQRRENAEIQIHVPLLLAKMKESGLFDDISYDNCTIFLTGGSAMSKHNFEYWQNKLKSGINIREGYGNTQTLGGNCSNLSGNYKFGTIGVPFPDFTYKLIDLETGEEITEPYKHGEIWITGPSVMKGELNNPNPDCIEVDEQGVRWNKTRDLAFFDEDHFFTFVDRVDDVINLNSANLVNPNIIRKVLQQFGIEESVIFKTTDASEEYDQIVVCIEYVADEDIIRDLVETMKKAFKRRLKSYEIPAEIVILPNLPLNLSGKPQKKQVEESYTNGNYTLKLTLK